jgi:hypothetical protein
MASAMGTNISQPKYSAAMNNAARIADATALRKAISSSVVRPLEIFLVIKLIEDF